MENKDRKIVFFDIDGTLVDGPTHQIPQSAVEAIRKLRENGHLAFINTGRTLVSIEPRIREIGFDGLVCGCGTHIYYEGETLFSHSILHEKCTEIVYELRRLGIPTFFEAEEHVYYDSRCMSPELGNSVSNFKSLNCSVPDMPERPEDSDVVFDKFFCLLRPDDPVDKLRSFIGDEFTAVPQGEHYLEIVPTGCSKAEGIHILQKKLGITFIYITHDQEEAINMSDRIAVMDGGRILQIGTPDEIYNHPKTSYVATFVGNANILHGIVESAENENVVIDLGCGKISAESGMDKDSAKLQPGEPVTLAVRSENIRLHDRDTKGLPATVLEKTFAGGQLRVTLQLQDHTVLTASRYGINTEVKEGQQIFCSFRPEDAVLVDREDAYE